MDRLACVRLPQLPLQIALKNHPEWKDFPVVVVREDRPSSFIFFLNQRALDDGLKAGFRYSEALSIVPEVRAVVISREDLEAARKEVLETLRDWSPEIEACPFDYEVFWVNASGLTLLHGPFARWGARVREKLVETGYHALVVVGFTRGGTYVLARRRSTVVVSLESEKRALERCPLNTLPLSFRALNTLERLNLKTIAEVIKIPKAELARRLGPEVMNDLKLLEDLAGLPLQPLAFDAPWERKKRLDSPISELPLLVPMVETFLMEVLETIRERGCLIAEIEISLVLETWETQTELLRPAEPTSNTRTLQRLIRFRLSRCACPASVIEIRFSWKEVPTPPGSGELFPMAGRDVRKGAEAIAMIRAKYGNASVVRALLCDTHLPELSFRWAPFEKPTPLSTPISQESRLRSVRRIFLKPVNLSDGSLSGIKIGSAYRLALSSLSQAVQEIDREYGFRLNRQNEVLWVWQDRNSGRFQIEGLVD